MEKNNPVNPDTQNNINNSDTQITEKTQEQIQKEHDIFSKKYYDFIGNIYNDKAFQNYTIVELKTLRKYAEELQQEYGNLELIVKKDANSLYGTSASIYYSLVDYDVAGDITGTGKHYAIIADTAINYIFVNWGEDELKIIQQFYPDVIAIKKFTNYEAYTKNDVCNYGDTDSRYINLDMIYSFMECSDGKRKSLPPNTTEGNKELSDFAVFLMSNFIDNAIKSAIEKDLIFRNGNLGYLKMAHEVTTRRCVFQAKKKYVLTTIWKDGKFQEKPKLKVLGVELKQGGLNERIKKIIEKLVMKYLIEDASEDKLREDVINLIGYIKKRAEKSFIYRIQAVSNLKEIRKVNDKYISDKNHLAMKMAISWMNFIEKNNLGGLYRPPFEGQKMNFYYDMQGDVIAIPDDVDIDQIKGLPEPDWNLMLKQILVRNLLKYIKEDKKITDNDVEHFLLGIKPIKF